MRVTMSCLSLSLDKDDLLLALHKADFPSLPRASALYFEHLQALEGSDRCCESLRKLCNALPSNKVDECLQEVLTASTLVPLAKSDPADASGVRPKAIGEGVRLLAAKAAGRKCQAQGLKSQPSSH